jgi:hypothetical protein
MRKNKKQTDKGIDHHSPSFIFGAAIFLFPRP